MQLLKHSQLENVPKRNMGTAIDFLHSFIEDEFQISQSKSSN